jgi:inner membrane protein
MIIGHLPSGYIVSKLLINKYWSNDENITLLMIVGTIGAIAPDIDMFYFYLVDKRHHHHHTYWTHYPILWVSIICISMFWYYNSKTKCWSKLCLLFSWCGFLHIILDSIVGDIWWGAPFLNTPFALFTIPALYNPWWLNFIFHWSFLLEVATWLFAFYLFLNKGNQFNSIKTTSNQPFQRTRKTSGR